MEVKFLGFDIETTGLLKNNNKESHRIIEVGGVLMNLNSGEILDKFIYRYNPLRQIDKGAYEVHKICLNDLKDEPTWEEASCVLVEKIRQADVLVAHNGMSFDFPFLDLELRRVGITPPKVSLFDTMTTARWATMNGKLPSLKELCFATDVDYSPDKAHNALYDVEVMMQALYKGKQLGFYKLDELTIPIKTPLITVEDNDDVPW